MTPQEVFDKVAAHLLTQNRKAMDEDEITCLNRSPDGLKCAVGCLIEDNEYKRWMEGAGLSDLLAAGSDPIWGSRHNLPPSLRARLEPHRDMLLNLQFVHDRIEVEDWPEHLAIVADQYGLEFKH